MFDLEQAITDWRQQMLVTGVKSPVPMEELENHLREEIEQQMKLRLNEQEAFQFAVHKIGQAGLLKLEFGKTDGFLTWLNRIKFMTIMTRKFGIGLVFVTLLFAAILQLTGASLVVRMNKITHQNGYTMVDNWWQPQWYAFALLGLFIAGIVLATLPKRKISEPVES